MQGKDSNLIEIKKVKFNMHKCVENNLFETNDEILYSNLYPIKFTKDIDMYEYYFKIEPEIHEENIILKIFRKASPFLFKTYGYYYRSGPSFFATKSVNERIKFKVIMGEIEYILDVHKYGHHSKIKRGQTHGFSEIDEKVIFLIIREILQANPQVHFDRDNLYLDCQKYPVNSNGACRYFIDDGYKISIQQADCGICLIIGVKKKIKGNFTVYDMMKKPYKTNIKSLIGRRFIPFEGSRHQQITEIDIDRNPINTTKNYKHKTRTYYEYYKKILNIEIKDKKQPLILTSTRNYSRPKYYIPELCTMIGINNEDISDYKFMQEIIEKTRLEPDKKIQEIRKCLKKNFDYTPQITIYLTTQQKKKLIQRLSKKIQLN